MLPTPVTEGAAAAGSDSASRAGRCEGGCRLHRDIQKGISPAMVNGAMTKNSADPRTAVTLLILIAP
jgi:hypothetical protein